MNNKIRDNRTTLFEWLATWLVIFFSGSAYAASNNSFYGQLKYLITFGIGVGYLIKSRGRIPLVCGNRKIAFWIPATWCLICFGNWIVHNNEEITLLLSRMLHLVLAYEVICIVSWDTFKRTYSKSIVGICLISLICFLFLDKTSLFSVIMPKLTGYTEYGVAYTKYQGFLAYFKTGDNRNYGAFWEPGLFATHIICAFLMLPYHRDGTADTDMYFDANGNPKALSKGQYGIKRSGKVSLLLDRNGNVMPCVDNLLNGFPCMVVVFGCVVCLLMIVLPKSLSVVLTMVYVAFILYETLMFRESGDARTNFVLFSYAGKFLKEQSVRVGVINNIWLFIPLGTGLYRWFQKRWVLLIPFVISMAIETTQYITGLGIAEFDDVFGNTMGGWIGILVAYIKMMWHSETVSRPQRHSNL